MLYERQVTCAKTLNIRTGVKVQDRVHGALVRDHDPNLHFVADEDQDVEDSGNAVEEVVANNVAVNRVLDGLDDLRLLVRARLVEIPEGLNKRGDVVGVLALGIQIQLFVVVDGSPAEEMQCGGARYERTGLAHEVPEESNVGSRHKRA